MPENSREMRVIWVFSVFFYQSDRVYFAHFAKSHLLDDFRDVNYKRGLVSPECLGILLGQFVRLPPSLSLARHPC